MASKESGSANMRLVGVAIVIVVVVGVGILANTLIDHHNNQIKQEKAQLQAKITTEENQVKADQQKANAN